MWRKIFTLDSLPITKTSLSGVNFIGEEISLEEIVSWKSYSGLKNDSKFAERPSENCVKIPKLSYMKFLEIFCEVRSIPL